MISLKRDFRPYGAEISFKRSSRFFTEYAESNKVEETA